MKKDMEEQKKLDSLGTFFYWLWIACIAIPAGLIFVIYYNAGAMPNNISDWGVFGDFVGGISNPFISAITFLALIFTIIQNQKVLRINEQELEETRKEIALTREANEKQAEELKLQNKLIRKDSEIESITQALLKLADKMRKDWDNHSSSFLNPKSVFACTLESVKERVNAHDFEAKRELEVAQVFVPVAISYIKLLIVLYKKDPEGPMMRSMVCLMGDVLITMRKNHYLEADLSDYEDQLLQNMLSEYYDRGFQQEVSRFLSPTSTATL